MSAPDQQQETRVPDPLTENERHLAQVAWSVHHDTRKWGNLVLAAYDGQTARLAAAETTAAGLAAQLADVDKHLWPWEPEPASETGVIGRVQTILNLKADRARLAAAETALQELLALAEDQGLDAAVGDEKFKVIVRARAALASPDAAAPRSEAGSSAAGVDETESPAGPPRHHEPVGERQGGQPASDVAASPDAAAEEGP